MSKLDYSREKKHKEFYQSTSQYFQGFFCSSGLVFLPLQFCFCDFKDIRVAWLDTTALVPFTTAYPHVCGVREVGGQTWACLHHSSGTGQQREAQLKRSSWMSSHISFSNSSLFPTVWTKMRQLHRISWSWVQASYSGVGKSTAQALTYCPGSSVQPIHSWRRTIKESPPWFEGKLFQDHSFLNL